MSILISNVRPALPQDWDHIWQECAYSTYFHSREWAEIWSVYTRGKIRPRPLMVAFSDGIKALLPVSLEVSRTGLARRYLSSPAATFGGWISTDQLGVEHAVLLTDYLTRGLGSLLWRVNPYDQLVAKTGKTATQDDETHACNLGIGFDAVYKRWARGARSSVRKALKEGVTVKQARTLEDWRAYYRAYEDSLRRWGPATSSRYSWEIFNEMFRLNSPHIKLWLAVYRELVVAGALCFYAPRYVVYWHGAALEKYFHLRAANLVMYEAVKDACEQGFSWFDLNPSGGHEGVKAFKKRLGPQALPCPVIRVTAPLSNMVEGVKAVMKGART